MDSTNQNSLIQRARTFYASRSSSKLPLTIKTICIFLVLVICIFGGWLYRMHFGKIQSFSGLSRSKFDSAVNAEVLNAVEKFVTEFEKWENEVFDCKLMLAESCAIEPMKSKVKDEFYKIVDLKMEFLLVSYSFLNLHIDQVHKLIDDSRAFMKQIELTQGDLCDESDWGCGLCVKLRVEEYNSNGSSCKGFSLKPYF